MSKTIKTARTMEDAHIAALVAGMRSQTDIEKRSITFTIHLKDRDEGQGLLKRMFEVSEEYFEHIGAEKKDVTYTSLLAFNDLDGSRYTGAAVDRSRIHYHGLMVLPHNTSEEDVDELIRRLRLTAIHDDNVRTSSTGIFIERYKETESHHSMKGYISYSMKGCRFLEGDLSRGIVYPFDLKNDLDNRSKGRINEGHKRALNTLSSGERYKIVKPPRSKIAVPVYVAA